MDDVQTYLGGSATVIGVGGKSKTACMMAAVLLSDMDLGGKNVSYAPEAPNVNGPRGNGGRSIS
jgi:hypothetical protein